MRGAESKELVTQKILEMFESSFIYGKELRIPLTENGERVEIKVALTCAKTNVGGDDGGECAECAIPAPLGETSAPTAEEKANIEALMNRLGI